MYLSLLDEEIKDIKDKYENKPFFVFLSLTNTCNANCVFCDVRTNEKMLCDIDVYKLIDELVELGTKYIHFTGGGEPLTDKNIFKYMEYASKKGLNIIFISNGYLLNEANIIKLSNYNIKAVFISIDSYNACVHNRLRKVNSLFENATKGINILKEYIPGVKINLNHVLNKDNIDDFDKFIDLKLKYDFDSINPILIKDCPELTPTKKQIENFKCKTKNYIEKLQQNKVSLLCESLNLFDDGIDDKGNRGQNIDMRCMLANFCAFIDAPTGKVYPCDCSIHRDRKLYCLGNLNEDSFKSIWEGEKRANLVSMLNNGELPCKSMCDESNCLFNKKYFEVLK